MNREGAKATRMQGRSQKIKIWRKYRRKFLNDFIKETSLPNIVGPILLFLHILKVIGVLVKATPVGKLPSVAEHFAKPSYYVWTKFILNDFMKLIQGNLLWFSVL